MDEAALAQRVEVGDGLAVRVKLALVSLLDGHALAAALTIDTGGDATPRVISLKSLVNTGGAAAAQSCLALRSLRRWQG